MALLALIKGNKMRTKKYLTEADRLAASRRAQEITQEIKRNFGRSTRLLVKTLARSEEERFPGQEPRQEAITSQHMMRQYIAGIKIPKDQKLLELVKTAIFLGLAGEKCKQYLYDKFIESLESANNEFFLASLDLPKNPRAARQAAERQLAIALDKLTSLKFDAHAILALAGIRLGLVPVVEQDWLKMSFMRMLDADPEEIDVQLIEHLKKMHHRKKTSQNESMAESMEYLTILESF